jgi:hypothetical protein
MNELMFMHMEPTAWALQLVPIPPAEKIVKIVIYIYIYIYIYAKICQNWSATSVKCARRTGREFVHVHTCI